MEPREIPVFAFNQLKDGECVTLYVGALPADTLIEIAKIDVFDAGKSPEGYQRAPIEYRVKQVSRYVRDHEGILPTAILVTVRENTEFRPAEEGADGTPTRGTLFIDPESSLWVIDGQHRIKGLQQAAEAKRSGDPDAKLGYEVPVVFALGLSLYEEMRLFNIVNSRAKSVPTDLAADQLRKMVKEEGVAPLEQGRLTDRDYRKAVGTRVAYHLNSSPGPWQGKIRLPNESRDNKRKPLQVNAVASSLEPALRDTYIRSIWEPELDNEWPTLRGLVYTYWSALAELMPEAFADIENHTIQRTAGTYAFNWILPDVVYRCLMANDFSTEGFRNVVGYLGKWVESETWHSDSDVDSLTRSTGMASIRQLADRLRRALPAVETPGVSDQAAAAV
jgi:DGQHR domain-containing protein